MSAVRDLAKGIELFNAAVISKLLGVLFPQLVATHAVHASGTVFGAVQAIEPVPGSGFAIVTQFGRVALEWDHAALKKIVAALCMFDLSTLIGLSEGEAIALIGDARDEPHVPDEIELIELGARWVRDNEKQLAVFAPLVGRPSFGASMGAIVAIDAKQAVFEERLQLHQLRFIEGPSLDDIARLSWELHHDAAWKEQTDATKEAQRGRSLDVIHALRAAGYAIVPPSASEPPPTLPTGAVP